MGQDITTTGSYADILAGLNNIMKTADTVSYKFLQFSGKEGRFKYRDGDNEKELAPGSRLFVDQNSIKHGYKCWKNSDVVDSYESDFTQALPPLEDMEDHGPFEDDRDGWQTYIAVMLKDTKSEELYRLEISSVSGRKSLGDMVRQIFEKAPLHRDGDALKGYAVVELGNSSFKSKGFKNYKPILTVVDWNEDAVIAAPQAALPAPAAEAEEDAAEEVTTFAVPKSRKG